MKQFIVPKISNFRSWEDVKKLDDFSYPWLNEKPPKTEFRAFFDRNNLYFRFYAWGGKPLVYVNNNDKKEVINSERVEIFFRPNEKMQPYYCLELDPLGRVLDYKANFYRDFDLSWQWPEDLEIETKVMDEGYCLKGKISLSILNKLDLIKNNQVQVGLYRGHCTEIVDGKASIKWISWLNSKTPQPDFHVPSSFGVFVLQ